MAPPTAMSFLKRGLSRFVNEAKVVSMRRKQAAKTEELRKKQQQETKSRLRRVETHNLKHLNTWGIVCMTTERGCFKQYWRAPMSLGQHIDELPEGLKAHQKELRSRGYSRCCYASCGVERGDHVMEVDILDSDSEPEEDSDDEMDIDEPLCTSNMQSLPEEMEGFEPSTTVVMSTPSLIPFTPMQAIAPPKPASTFTCPQQPSMDIDSPSMMADIPSKAPVKPDLRTIMVPPPAKMPGAFMKPIPPPTTPARKTVMMPPPAKKPGTFMNLLPPLANKPGTFLKVLPPPIAKPAGGHANVVQTAPVAALTPIPSEAISRTAQEQIIAGVYDAAASNPPSSSTPSTTCAYNAAASALPVSNNTFTSSKATSQCTTPTKERKDASSVPTSTANLSSLPSSTFSCQMPLKSSNKPLPRTAQMEVARMADVNITAPAPQQMMTQDTVMSMSSTPAPETVDDTNNLCIAQSQANAHKKPAIRPAKIALRVGWQPRSWNRNGDIPKDAVVWNVAHRAPAKSRILNEDAAEQSEYLEDLNKARRMLDGGENFEKSTREVRELFEKVYELCKTRDQFIDASDREFREVDSVEKLSSQSLGSYVPAFQPRKPCGLSEQKRDLFEDDLITIQREDEKLWEHLIGALLQRNCSLEQLLVDILDENEDIEKDWEVFQIVLKTCEPVNWGINWQRVDDVSAKVRYGVSQDTEDFYTATTLKGSSRKDFNVVMNMVTSKGYFYTFADQVKQWAMTHPVEFLQIVRRAGFVNPAELAEMTNLVSQIEVMSMEEGELWEKRMLACIAARYPYWYDWSIDEKHPLDLGI